MKNRLLIVLALLTLFVLTEKSLKAATLRVPEDYPGIQSAVDRAAPGDHIIVNAGTYVENIAVKKPLVLKSAEGPDETIVTAENIDKPTVTVTETSDVSVEGLTITGSDISGIMLNKADTSTISNNRLVNNAKGLVLLNSNGNSLTGNVIDENDQYGLYLFKSNFNTVSENSVDKNGDKGLFISYSNNNAIVGNHANLNMWNGIVLWSSNYNLVTENKTLRNTYGIVESESTGNVVTNNIIWPNIFIILPVLLIYMGILTYIIQKRLLKAVYRV